MPCTKEEHEKLRRDDRAWSLLKRRRDWVFDDGEVLEQRDCPKCGSTLARPKVPREEPGDTKAVARIQLVRRCRG